MKYLILSFVLAVVILPAYAQHDTITPYPDGIYYTLDDFLQRRADTTVAYRKLNLNVPFDKAFTDTLVNHVWFLDKNNDLIRKIFAIVYKGEIYFHQFGMKKNLSPDFGQKSHFKTKQLHRVHERGRYLYGVFNYRDSNSPYAIIAGTTFGAIGGALAALAESASPSGIEIEAPFAFDTATNTFYAFRNRRHLQAFLNSYYGSYGFEVERGKLDLEAVRQLFVELNQ